MHKLQTPVWFDLLSHLFLWGLTAAVITWNYFMFPVGILVGSVLLAVIYCIRSYRA